MPLFFFISGYLYKIPENRISQLKKNIKGLLWPYFTFYILNWLVLFILFYVIYTIVTGNNNITISNTFVKPFLGMLYGVGYDTENSWMFLRALWFLIALFVMKTTFDIVTKFIKNLVLIGTISLLLWLVSQILVRYNIDLYWSIDSAFTAIPFFAFGYILRSLKINWNLMNKKWYYNILIALILFLLVYILSKINGTVDVNGNLIGNYGTLFFINALLGIAGVISISQLNFKLNHIFSYLSQNTLLIIFLHYTFILIIFKIIPNNLSDITYFFFSIGLLLFLYLPIQFINKYIPFIVSPVFKKQVK